MEEIKPRHYTWTMVLIMMTTFSGSSCLSSLNTEGTVPNRLSSETAVHMLRLNMFQANPHLR